MSVDAVTRQEMYLQYLAGDTAITLPEPVTRIEKYWWDIAKRIEAGVGPGGGITVDSALSETSTNPVQNKVVSKRFGELSEQKANKNGMTLDVHTDGLIYLFVDGKPVGNGVEVTGEVVEGDVIGTLDENNNILLSGALADGTYTLKFENADGTFTDLGSLVVGATGESYKNLADPTSEEWLDGYRITSGGVVEQYSGVTLVNTIYCANTDTVRIKGMTGIITALYKGDTFYARKTVNTSNFAHVVTNGDYTEFIPEYSGVTSIRFYGTLSGTAEDVIITVNQEIV